MPNLIVADLFCGCGGLTLGFQKGGIPIALGIDYWKAALENYTRNFDHPCIEADISDTRKLETILREHQINFVIGGPPCQDFSQAGKRKEEKRASLTEAYAQIIAQVKPIGFLMENVDRAKKSQSYAKAREVLKNSGYGLTEIVLDASKCGVPQKRKRFFVFGILGEEDGFWEENFKENISSQITTLKDYFGDSLGFEYYYRHPRNYNRRAIFSIYEPAPTMRGVNRPIPKGYKGHPSDPIPVSEVSHALTTNDRIKIQTFPDFYQWIGTKTDIEQMIGNAVPCELAKFVAERVIDYFDFRSRTVEIQDLSRGNNSFEQESYIRYNQQNPQGQFDFRN